VLGCTCIGRWDEAVDIVKQLYWFVCHQASAAICHSQHEPSSPNSRASTAPVDPDALLHETYADTQSLYNGRQGKRYPEWL
jgi:hypothetical protein